MDSPGPGGRASVNLVGMSSKVVIQSFLDPRLEPAGREWLASAADEVQGGVSDARFVSLLSLAARKLGFAVRKPWSLTEVERTTASTLMEGWNPTRWTGLEAARFVLVMSRPDLLEETGPAAILNAFKFADEGEQCALYRCLGHLPQPAAYLWRAKEGCRTNMLSVFEANVLDTPYPALHFDELALNQAAIKALFIGVPLWRLWNLDKRLSPELARMALDLAVERRAATRPVQPELWMCLGTFGGERGLAALEEELAPHLAAGGPPDARCPESGALRFTPEGARAAVLALGRAGASARLGELAVTAPDFLRPEIERALRGGADQTAWAALDPREASPQPQP